MIAAITGKVIELDSDTSELVVQTTSGVAYSIKVAAGQYLEGDDVQLFCQTLIQDTRINLWGFTSWPELKLFRLLIGVSGVGPTSAASLIHTLGLQKLLSAILSEDAKALKVPGVGMKTAQKVIIELQTKLEKSSLGQFASRAKSAEVVGSDQYHDAVMVLQSLGFSASEAAGYFQRTKPTETDTSKLVKKFLSDK